MLSITNQPYILCDSPLAHLTFLQGVGGGKEGFTILCPSSLHPIWLSSVFVSSGVDSEACKPGIQEALAPNAEAVLMLVPELSGPGGKGGTIESSKALAPCDLKGGREGVGPRPFLCSCPTFDWPL